LACHRFLVRVSYLEIYNEEVRDLLGKDQNQRLEVGTLTSLNALHYTQIKVIFLLHFPAFVLRSCGKDSWEATHKEESLEASLENRQA